MQDAYDFDFQINRPEREWPLARTQYKKLYLDAAGMSMSFEPYGQEAKISYDGQTGMACFDMPFAEDTEITGHMKLRLFVEADGHDDMDLFINIQKLDEDGNWLPISVLGEPHPGAWGKMRVSARELDPKLSTDYQPIQAHINTLKLSPGEIVPVDIEIWRPVNLAQRTAAARQICGRYIRENGLNAWVGCRQQRDHIITPADSTNLSCRFRCGMCRRLVFDDYRNRVMQNRTIDNLRL